MSQTNSPFCDRTEETIASMSETRLIQSIQEWLGNVCPVSPHGIGDDCAVTDISNESKYLLTTVDGVAWGEHFDTSVTPGLAGRKLMARNLSDIASMGGKPRRAVVSLWMAKSVRLDWLRQFYEGIAKLAEEFEVQVVGGDVARAPEGVFIADLCLQGMSDRPLERKQVQPGDSIWVTGSLGGSILGKHTAFIPRIAEGLWLNEQKWAKSMMDISDGLAKDLPSLVGKYHTVIDQLPLSDAALELSKESGKDPWEHALCDGEDYELVFATDREIDESKFLQEWKEIFETPITRIAQVGDARPEFAMVLNRGAAGQQVFEKRGYEHF